MNILARLIFVSLSVLCLFIFGNDSIQWSSLSIGQGLTLGSVLPMSLTLLAAAFYTKKNKNEVIALMVMFVGIFVIMLSIGSYKLTGELPYGVFAFLGIMLCCTAVAMITFYSTRQPISANG